MIVHCKYDDLVPLIDLKEHPKNRNKHSKDQIERLTVLYQYQGIRHPIIVSKLSGYIVAGHGRKAAAENAHYESFPVVYQDFENEDQEYAFIQSDNAIALWAELDLSGINTDVVNLGPDFDIDFLGIKNFKLDLCEAGDVPDQMPERVEPRAKLGDVYALGNHRLMCGDSTKIDDVDKLLCGEKPHLMITDPPYGVKYEAGWRAEAKGVKKTERELTSSLQNDDEADWYDAYVLFPGSVAYVWHASAFTDVVMDGLRRAGFRIKQQIIWNKNVHALSRSDYHRKHEPCWYAVKNGGDSHWNGDRKQMTIWDVKNVAFEGDKTDHPTQKPVRIYEIAIENNSKDQESIYDPFSGSGSAFIAAERLGRFCFGMELDPKFVDTIIARWEKFTGKTAELLNG